MLAILRKEFSLFFASPIGYLVISVYLVFTGLFLWVFKGDFNILNAGFADLNSFFFITPWFFIFLIPAVTMRSFSDEIRLGTIEILKTKPITIWQIVIGKYFGSLSLIILALIPTLTYVYTVNHLGNPVGNLDVGSTLGSYFGLLFLSGAFTAIGLFASSLSKNQIVSFIIGVTLCFIMYFGFEALAELIRFDNFQIVNLGMNAHFKSISRGVIDSNDLVYFISISYLFLYLTKLKID